jgi:hypothetical protein
MIDSQSIIHVLQILMSEKAGEELKLFFIDEKCEHACEHAVIWANDDSFPISILNSGCPSNSDWDGDPEIIKLLQSMAQAGYCVMLCPREVDDETHYNSENQDYKLIIRG